MTKINKLDVGLEMETLQEENNITYPDLSLNDLKIQMQKLKALNNEFKIENKPAIVEYPAKDIIEKLITDLFEYDTNFLKDYHNVLQSNDTASIKEVTNNILSSIQQTIRHQRSTGKPLNEWAKVTLAAWLSAATLWSAPRVPEAARTFQSLLDSMDANEMKRVAEMWWRSVPVDALLELAAVARAPPAPRALADMLLRAALHQLAPRGAAPQWGAGALQAAELEDAVGRVGAGAELLRVAGRVLATDPSKSLLACLAHLPCGGGASDRCERLQISVSVPKFHLLFGEGGTRLKSKRGRKRKIDTSSIDDAVDVDIRQRLRKTTPRRYKQ
ncbi:uncharacterized protein LOC125073099 [Vanessa atalanta]|uniref:uncharacterized protein LOC125073099 n=1 Tax=Vanessa atalanta TaxID=42275 RepID=UPI001FCCF627|nr:uncharacterized protein LOC125073099 [Vanessa atalanta]